MSKFLVGILSLLSVTIVGSCHTTRETSSNAEIDESRTLAEFEAVPEVERKTVNKYTIHQKAGERVFVFSTNLKTKDSTQSLSTPFFSTSDSQKLELSFAEKDRQFEAALSVTGSEDIQSINSFSIEQNYSEFIPYESIRDGKLGVIVLTDDPMIISELKKDPAVVAKFLASEAEFYEQSLVSE